MQARGEALQSVNVAISQWSLDGGVQHHIQCENSSIHLEFLQDGDTYFLCIDPNSSLLCSSLQTPEDPESLGDRERQAQIEQGDRVALEMIAADFAVAMDNLRKTIIPQIRTAGYTVYPIRGDGNCGFYAILQALHPDQDYAHVRPGTPQWNDAATLRQRIVEINPALFALGEMVVGLQDRGGRWMRFDALPAVAHHLAITYRRPLIAINTNPTETYPMFAIYRTDGNIQSAGDFPAALAAAGENPVILLGTPGHWNIAM